MKKWGYKVNLWGKKKDTPGVAYFWHVYYEIEGKRKACKRAMEEEIGDYDEIGVLSVEKLE